ncbi:MAG: hypothetical protein JNK75_00240, partial [Betaproteobacteria bacterium]|nr:hypothetical protein [Betaproteobacteria bacterium]
KSENQFYAVPVDGVENYFADPDGLSGGPVYALKKIDGLWYYKVIGIQSSLYLGSGTLAICPFSSFGAQIELVVKEVIAELVAGDKGQESVSQ